MKHGPSTTIVAGITAALVAGLVTVSGISAAQVGGSQQGGMMGPPPMGRGTGAFLDVYNVNAGTIDDIIERKNDIKINKFNSSNVYPNF